MKKAAFALTLLTLAVGGCGEHSALQPAGEHAARLAGLTWIFIGVCAAVFVIVMVYLLWALVRPRAAPMVTIVAPDPTSLGKLHRAIAVAGGLTALTLLGLLVASAMAGHAEAASEVRLPMSIRVVGHQWWWEFEYTDPDVSKTVTTANEIHVPVGRTILLELSSHDVIHSFWVPRLAGKIDLIPSRTNQTKLLVDAPGRFRGQCAEFCGYQHAHMAFWIIAEPERDFEAWLQHERAPATPPADESTRRGAQLFASGPCPMCHTVRGTDAAATVGPDLTHIAGRSTLASGAFPNTRDHLRTLVTNIQRMKPGALMPDMALPADDLDVLMSYLRGLQ
ncbi:MAG TPA: cytochrome c oxidase subunit II [Polyangiaceae bacterium]|nr:cytochrome c oxidase subunit II [Polyangiaceae bacterium]